MASLGFNLKLALLCSKSGSLTKENFVKYQTELRINFISAYEETTACELGYESNGIKTLR